MAALRAGHGSPLEVPELTEALIAFYDGRFEDVAGKVEEVLARAPWLYEAKLLAGDAARATSHEARGAGDHDAALAGFSAAEALYREAAAIDLVEDAVKRSLAIDPGGGLAKQLRGRAALLAARFLLASDTSPEAELRRAGRALKEALDINARDAETHLALAWLELCWAQWLGASGRDAGGSLSRGITAARQATEIKPDMAEAHAVVALLLLEEARLARDPARRAECAAEAQSCLRRALSINPLLQVRYGAALNRAESTQRRSSPPR